jgi:hypothetical protein
MVLAAGKMGRIPFLTNESIGCETGAKVSLYSPHLDGVAGRGKRTIANRTQSGISCLLDQIELVDVSWSR